MGFGISPAQAHDDQEEDRPAVPSCAFPPPASLLVLVLTTPSYPLALLTPISPPRFPLTPARPHDERSLSYPLALPTHSQVTSIMPTSKLAN